MAKKPPYPVYKPKKRPAVHKSNAPTQVPVILAALGIALVIGLLFLVGVLPEKIAQITFGGLVILSIAFASVYQVHFKLKKKLVALFVGIGVPVWVLGAGLILVRSVYFPEALLDRTLTRESRLAEIKLGKGAYRLYVHGYFPPPVETPKPKADDEAAAKATPTPAPAKTYDLKGNFVLALTAAGGTERGQSFSGTLESQRQKRRVSKRGRGYVDVDVTRRLYPFTVGADGTYNLELKNLDPALKDELLVEVFPDSRLPWLIAAIGLLVTLLLTFLDFLIREAREYSFFGLGSAAGITFTLYFRMLAMPDSTIGAVVMTAAVGALIGVVVGMILEFALRRVFYRLNRKWRIDLA